MQNLELFRKIVPRKISLGLKKVPDLAEPNSGIEGKVLKLRDISDSQRHVIVSFDVEGRLRNIKLGRKFLGSEVKILERSFDGTFYVYSGNCKNLKPGHEGVYSYYDYYEEEICKDLKTAKTLVRSLDSLLRDITKADYRTTDTLIFTELEIAEDEIHTRGKIEQIPSNLVEILENARTKYSWEGLLRESSLFREVYPTPISVLPPEVGPDQNPVFAVLQITQGCWVRDSPRGPCKFCASYIDTPYREKNINELSEHIRHAKKFIGRGWNYVRKLFLADADPLHTKTDSAVYLKFLAREVPEAVWYEAFVSTSTILSKSENQWKKLMELGLKRLYWGVESADNKTLELLGKPHNNEMLYKAAYKLNSIGIPYAVIVMSGIGALNPDRSEKDVIENPHIRGTAKFIRDVNCPIVYISKFVPQQGTEIFNLMQSGRLKFLSPRQSEKQHRIMVKMAGRDAENSYFACREVRGKYGTQFVHP